VTRHRIEVWQHADGTWCWFVTDGRSSVTSYLYPDAASARADAEQFVTHREHGTVQL
jgi:hypothetical protein